MSRYARQEVLPEIGATGQARLRAARVLVVGAGGLGVPVLQYLAGAGVGAITIVDGDVVSETNLHRQPVYGMNDIGQPKAEVAAQVLARLNPEVEVAAITEWFDPSMGAALAAEADLVMDCADTFAVALSLSDLCLEAGVPLISGSVLARAGYVLGCCGGAPSLRAVFPDLPVSAATCATAGVMGPVVGVIGSLQGQMGLAALLGWTPSPLGQLVTVDAASWRMGGFRFDGAPEPANPLPFIAEDAITEADHVIDLRAEVAQPFRADATHVPPERITEIETNAPRVVLACRTGLRAQNAGQRLQEIWPGEIALLAVTDPNR